jgi:hypothetical protein
MGLPGMNGEWGVGYGVLPGNGALRLRVREGGMEGATVLPSMDGVTRHPGHLAWGAPKDEEYYPALVYLA